MGWIWLMTTIAIVCIRLNQIALVGHEIAGPSGYGRVYIAIFQLKTRIFDHSLVSVYRCLKGSGIGADLVILFLGHITFFYEFGIATDLFACIFELSSIFCKVCFRLFQRSFIRTGIDGEEEISLCSHPDLP